MKVCKTCGGEIRQADLDEIQARLGVDAARRCTTCLPCRRRAREMARNWDGENMLVCTECRWPIAPEYVATLELKMSVLGLPFHPPRWCPWCKSRMKQTGPRLSIEKARQWREALEGTQDRAWREAWEADNSETALRGTLPGGHEAV